jgi:2-amino-4-hydroxy-6-hydroxymethyldihydropteridine diphosphokinase
MPDCLVAFGSNLGDGAAIFTETLLRLFDSGTIDALHPSELVRTRAVGGSGQRLPFLNACIRFQTKLPMQAVFEKLVDIERQLGRKRVEHWGDRIVDLDLLLCGDRQHNDDQLVVPHPRMSFRRFVLYPASQIAADMIHPPSGLAIAGLLAHLDTRPNQIALASAQQPEYRSTGQLLSDCCAAHDWDFQPVYDVQTLANVSASAKLLMYADGIDPQLFQQARQFSGPTLHLGRLDPRKAVIETEAAIQSMSRL